MTLSTVVCLFGAVWALQNNALAFTPIHYHKNHVMIISSQPSSGLFMGGSDDKPAMDVCLEKLEKRVAEGPGSLDRGEVSDLEFALNDIVKELQSEGAPASEEDLLQLKSAAVDLDASTVSAFAKKGITMDEETTEAAFWAVVNEVDRAEQQDEPLSANVPRMLHHIFDADLDHLLTRDQVRTNVTCMMPDETGGMAGAARRMNYIFDDGDIKHLPLAEGRRCEDGNCCDACSRNIFPTFASDDETSLDTFPELASLTFNDLEKVSAATIIQFVRLVERVRRTISHEYGLPLKTILPLQAYSRKYVAGTTQQGGGGGEGDFVTLHCDEATHTGYHYSCVMYLSTSGKDFEGGDFVFNDPVAEDDETLAAAKAEEDDEDAEEEERFRKMAEEMRKQAEETRRKAIAGEGPTGGDEEDEFMSSSLAEEIQRIAEAAASEDEDEEDYSTLAEEIRRAGRQLTPYSPTRGSAVIFSSGWENLHEVEKITSGVRYAVPAFFTTCPVPDVAYEQMNAGKPQNDEMIADDWLHLLLAHRKESPIESVGRVKELLMKWHYMCSPLSEH